MPDNSDNWTIVSFGIAVFIASLPAIISAITQAVSNAKQLTRQNEFYERQERRRNDFEIDHERRAEQRDREKMLWQLELDKFQKLEVLLNELVSSVCSPAAEIDTLRNRFWLAVEQFSLGFPNYADIAEDLQAIEPLYAAARQNQDVDVVKLREHCKSIIMTGRTALVVGLPITVIEGQQVTSKPRSYS